jgi:hypothetical protein
LKRQLEALESSLAQKAHQSQVMNVAMQLLEKNLAVANRESKEKDLEIERLTRELTSKENASLSLSHITTVSNQILRLYWRFYRTFVDQAAA